MSQQPAQIRGAAAQTLPTAATKSLLVARVRPTVFAFVWQGVLSTAACVPGTSPIAPIVNFGHAGPRLGNLVPLHEMSFGPLVPKLFHRPHSGREFLGPVVHFRAIDFHIVQFPPPRVVGPSWINRDRLRNVC